MFLFAVFADKKQPKQVKKCLKFEKISASKCWWGSF